MTWALEWRSNSSLGRKRYFVHENCLPVLFRTRAGARTYADHKFGYIRKRGDLRSWPHYWLMPRATRVHVVAA